MKKLFIFLPILLSLSSTYAQISDSECATGKILSLQKRQQNERLVSTQAVDNNIDVTYYKLNLGLTYSPRNIKGEVTIYAKSKTSNLSQVIIDLQNALTTDSVKVGNIRLPFVHQQNQIRIKLSIMMISIIYHLMDLEGLF